VESFRNNPPLLRRKTTKIPPSLEGGQGGCYPQSTFFPLLRERIRKTIPLYPPLLRGKIFEIPPSLEGSVPKGRGMLFSIPLFHFTKGENYQNSPFFRRGAGGMF